MICLTFTNNATFAKIQESSQNAKQEVKQTRPFKVFMILFAKNFGECERGFTNYMRSRGINIEYTIRDCNGQLSGCPLEKYIAEAKQMQPDLIYTWGTPVTSRVAGVMGEIDPEKHITKIPIIALPIANPIGADLTTKMKNPTGRNLAGVSQMMSVVEQIRAIRIYGDFKRIGAIYTPYEPNISTFIDEWHREAQRLKGTKEEFEFVSYQIGLDASGKLDRSSIPKLLKKLLENNIQFLYMGPDTAILEHRDLIIDWCLENKIPIFASSELTINKVKPTLGFFSRFYHVGQLAGLIAEKILLKRYGNSKEKFPGKVFQFQTLKHMSYTVNVEDGIKMGQPPPIVLIKFAEIIKREAEE